MERPEHRVLLACARACSAPQRNGLIIPCLAERIDWEYLLQTAEAHMMTSLLCWHLNAARPDAVPQAILEKLNDHLRKKAAIYLLFTVELHKILDLFERNGIPAIPFKGPVLALTLYENPALREFGDLDIIVRKQDAFRALRLLTALGYKRIADYSPAVEGRILKQEYHLSIGKESGPVFVEAHWNVMDGYFHMPIPVESWWGRAEPVTVEGRQVLNLAAEDLLAALSAHGCKHVWQPLIWIADLARLLDRHPDLNWDYVFNKYAHPDLQRMIYVGLLAARNLLGAALPEKILQKARQDAVAADLAREAEEGLFRQQAGTEGSRVWRFQFRLKSSWTGRLRSCLLFVLLPSMIEWNIALPRFLFPLYFVLRPIRLCLKYLSRPFRRRPG
jgi:hypothetical protein